MIKTLRNNEKLNEILTLSILGSILFLDRHHSIIFYLIRMIMIIMI